MSKINYWGLTCVSHVDWMHWVFFLGLNALTNICSPCAQKKKCEGPGVLEKVITHIFLHILRFDSLVWGVRRVQRPKGEAGKKKKMPGLEERNSLWEQSLWVLTQTLLFYPGFWKSRLLVFAECLYKQEQIYLYSRVQCLHSLIWAVMTVTMAITIKKKK